MQCVLYATEPGLCFVAVAADFFAQVANDHCLVVDAVFEVVQFVVCKAQGLGYVIQ